MGMLPKVFLLGAILYLTVKGILFFLLYLATVRVEQKGLEQKRRRERILRIRRVREMEMYRRQYEEAEKRNKEVLTAIG
ncbi:MAG: hypothetical protein ACM3UZ_08300 [Acidobacteriota bacterium]